MDDFLAILNDEKIFECCKETQEAARTLWRFRSLPLCSVSPKDWSGDRAKLEARVSRRWTPQS
jgi:hypothetical protein